MLTETDDEALEAESREDVLLDAAVAYEAGVWRDLQGGRHGAASGGPSRGARKRWRCRRGSRNERGWCELLCVYGSARCLKVEGTCRCRWVRLRNRMPSR